MWLIDTTIFLRVLVREDERAFADCVALLEEVKTGKKKAITAGLVLAEMAWVLHTSYGLGRKEVAQKVDGVRLLPGIKVVDTYDYAWAIKHYSDKKVKFIDACLASVPQVRNGECTVVSYDSDFARLDCNWKKPGELLQK